MALIIGNVLKLIFWNKKQLNLVVWVALWCFPNIQVKYDYVPTISPLSVHSTPPPLPTPQLNINNSVRNSIIFHNYPQCGCLENCSVRTQWLSVHGYTSSNKTLCIPAILKLLKQLWKKFQQFRSPLFLCKELDRLSAKWVQLVCSIELSMSDCERKIKSFERYFIASIFGC